MVYCGASVSELYHVVIGSMVVMYILHVCNVYMHNAQYDVCTNLCISSLGIVCLGLSISTSLIFPSFVGCFCHTSSSLSRFRVRSSRFSLSCDGFRVLLEVFMFTHPYIIFALVCSCKCKKM